jgi:hypothetical protein
LVDKPYFEEKRYSHYHRSRRLKKKLLSQSYIRNKRQLHFDPMAKHVEILVAYDDSIKDFHSGIDIKSYILTLFSYVSHRKENSIGNLFPCIGFAFIF